MAVTSAYVAKEEAIRRKPVELYHLWTNSGSHWYYTSGDVSVVFDANTYVPATIKRGMVEKNSELDVSTLSVQLVNLGSPISDFFEINPIEVIWISVAKLHREQDPLEANIIFLGQIKDIAFSGVSAEISCVGFEQFLKMPIPQLRFQINCNHKVFDTNCGLDSATYKVTTSITLDTTETQLTHATFDTYADGYFTGGKVKFNNEYRGIIAHAGSIITMAYKMKDLISNDTVDVYPGCDGRLETCRDKYNNVIHSLAFRYIPYDNPTERTSL